MIAVVALLFLIAGPALSIGVCVRFMRRVNRMPDPPSSRDQIKVTVTDGEAGTFLVGLVMAAAAIGTLAVMAVFG